jgi:hypothetical protein
MFNHDECPCAGAQIQDEIPFPDRNSAGKILPQSTLGVPGVKGYKTIVVFSKRIIVLSSDISHRCSPQRFLLYASRSRKTNINPLKTTAEKLEWDLSGAYFSAVA